MEISQLRTAFKELFSKDYILSELAYIEKFAELSSEDIVKEALSEIVTKDMLNYINEHLTYEPLAKMETPEEKENLLDCVYSDAVKKVENSLKILGKRCANAPLLSTKKVFCLGKRWDNTSYEEDNVCITYDCLFIDEDGKIFGAREYFQGFLEGNGKQHYKNKVYIYEKTGSEYIVSFNNLGRFFPEDYELTI